MKPLFSIANLAIALAITITIYPTQASAVIIEHLFTGTITETSNLFPQIEIGDPFTATLRFNTAEVPVIVGSTAFYTDYTFEFAADGVVFPGVPFTTLGVDNDVLINNIIVDRFLMDRIETGHAGFALEDLTGTAFDSFALPTVLDLADFTFAHILALTGATEESEAEIRGTIQSVSTSVVPGPSPLLSMLVAGAIWLGIVARHRFPLFRVGAASIRILFANLTIRYVARLGLLLPASSMPVRRTSESPSAGR